MNHFVRAQLHAFLHRHGSLEAFIYLFIYLPFPPLIHLHLLLRLAHPVRADNSYASLH